MQEQCCGICGYPLRFLSVRLATVNGIVYHAACWVFRAAPGAQTSAPVN